LANDLIEHSRSSISPAPAGLFCFCHIHASRHWALLPPLAFTSARRIHRHHATFAQYFYRLWFRHTWNSHCIAKSPCGTRSKWTRTRWM